MNADWKWPGSRWWRVDLHAHSPASYDSRGPDQENPDWIGWITAVRDADIHAVAITDHNTAAAVKSLKDAAREVEDAPIVFPGVELTAGGGSHLLLLMDPEREQEHVEDLLSRVELPVDLRSRQSGRSPLSVEQILDKCGDDALVIGAHGNRDRGVLKLEGEQRIAVLRHPGLAAVEIEPPMKNADRWLDGSLPEIGRAISQVWSSDGHDFDELGRRFTWVKMTEPNLEGLRLALLDGDDSLKRAAQADPNAAQADPNAAQAALALESITVHEGKFMGRSGPTGIAFGPWLNAIIGGRGTGKSSLIDFCRKTLRRESELDASYVGEEGPLRSFFESRMRVPQSRSEEGLLTGKTRIEVVYRKDGERFILSWSQDGDAHPIARLDGDERSPEEGDIRERFPVRIYSQKQLFALAQHPNALLTAIDDSQTVRGKELEHSIEQIKARYLSLRAEVREQRNLVSDLPTRRAALADIRRKLDLLQQGGHAQALSEYRMRRWQDDTWQAILRGASQAVDEVDRAAQALSVANLDLGADEESDQATTSLQGAQESLRQAIERLQRSVHEAVEQVRQEIQGAQDGPATEPWREALDVSERASQEASARLAEEGIADPDQFASLLRQTAGLERVISDLESAQERADKLENDANEVLAEYRRRREELSDSRKQFVRTAPGEIIRVEINELSNCENLAEKLSEFLGIERFGDDRQAIARRIRAKQDESWNWERLDDEVAKLRRFHSEEQDSWEAQDHRFEAALKRVPPEGIDRLALYLPVDDVIVHFRDQRGSKWRPIRQGSPGQQSAALLAFVLGYGGEPIILDQPEDDLDSTLIYELLVSRLRETKLNRQVIVVTHNPNIVVHGDAELVHSLEAGQSESRIACQGGLQERQVREEICRVMEGGREAFERRYQRIMPPRGSGP